MIRLSPGWRAVVPGVATLIAVMGIGRFVYTPILPEMLASGALTLREAGWIAAANFAGYLAGAMAASAIHGPRAQSLLARAGLVATVATLAAMAVTDGLLAWGVARFVSGVASAFALVFVANQVLERLTRIGEADRLVFMFAGVGVGIAGSALSTLALDAAGAGWRAPWAVAAALAAAVSAIAWGPAGAGLRAGPRGPAVAPAAAPPAAPPAAPSAAAPVAPPAAPGTPSAAAAPAPAAPRAFAAAVVAYGLFGLGYVIHATYLPSMVRAAGWPPAAAHWIWVVVGISAIASSGAWRALARRRGARAAVVGCYLVEGTTALLPMLAPGSIAAAAIAAIGLGATFIPVTGVVLPFVRTLDAANGARAIGLMTAAFGAGQIVGPVAAAYMADASARAAAGSWLAANPFGPPSALACVVLLAAAALMRLRLDARA